MPGRPPVPIEVKLRNGSYRPSRDGPLDDGQLQILKSSNDPPDSPVDLDDDGNWCWSYICEYGYGVQQSDAMILKMVCVLWSELLRIADRLKRIDDVASREYGSVSRRCIEFTQRIDSMLSQFGLSPAARSRMQASAQLAFAARSIHAAEKRSNAVQKTQLDSMRPDDDGILIPEE